MSSNQRSISYMVVALFILSCQLLTAGTTGKLAGRVIDNNGESLAGVNIILEETSLGASADEDGQFFIINIPPGIYTVQALYIGYTTRIIQNVQINVDRTTKIDISLEEEVLEGTEAIVVIAEKEIIQMDYYLFQVKSKIH